MESVLPIVAGGIIALYLVVMEAIDMAARVEWIDENLPWLTRWAQSHAWYRALLIVAMSMVGYGTYKLLSVPVPTIIFPQLRVPTITKVNPAPTAPKPEPKHDDPLHISTVFFGLGSIAMAGKQGGGILEVGLTNKPISPVDVTLTCNSDMEVFAGPTIGGHNVYERSGWSRKDNKTITIQIGSPAWAENAPLGMAVWSEDSNLTCTYELN